MTRDPRFVDDGECAVVLRCVRAETDVEHDDRAACPTSDEVASLHRSECQRKIGDDAVRGVAGGRVDAGRHIDGNDERPAPACVIDRCDRGGDRAAWRA